MDNNIFSSIVPVLCSPIGAFVIILVGLFVSVIFAPIIGSDSKKKHK